jgi:hypothetical protein
MILKLLFYTLPIFINDTIKTPSGFVDTTASGSESGSGSGSGSVKDAIAVV